MNPRCLLNFWLCVRVICYMTISKWANKIRRLLKAEKNVVFADCGPVCQRCRDGLILSNNISSLLDHRLRHWPTFDWTLVERMPFAECRLCQRLRDGVLLGLEIWFVHAICQLVKAHEQYQVSRPAIHVLQKQPWTYSESLIETPHCNRHHCCKSTAVMPIQRYVLSWRFDQPSKHKTFV